MWKIFSGLIGALFLSTAANATYYYIDVQADAGTYSPIAFGDNLEVDACGSTVHHYANVQYNQPWQPLFGLCTLSDLSDFTLTWKAQLGGSVTTLGTFSGANAALGLNASFATGAGTFFSTAGNYIISLYLDIPDNNAYVPLPDGYSGIPGADSGYIPGQSGWRNADYNESSFTLLAAPVSEPLAALLLLPGLALMYRQQRKRRSVVNVE